MTFLLTLKLQPTLPIPVISGYSWTEVLTGGFVSEWPAAPVAGNMMISGVGVRGNAGPPDASDTPISNTGTVGNVPNPGDDIAGTEWTLVTGSNITIAPAPGSPVFDNPGDQLALAYKVAAIGESQKNYWRTPANLRSHYVQIPGLSGPPTVTGTLNGYQSSDNTTFTSPNLVVPAAGWIVGMYGSNLTGPADGPYPNSSMTAVAPAVIFPDGHYGGTTQGWTELAAGYHPYSVLWGLLVAASGTYNVTLLRTAFSGWIHDGAAWSWAFWPL